MTNDVSVDNANELWFETHWNRFRAEHADWLTRREREGEVLYRLPRCAWPELPPLLQITPEARRAEQAFEELCRRFHAVGIAGDRPIPYRWLEPQILPPSADMLAPLMKKYGWSPEDIGKVPDVCRVADDVDVRIQGVAGRLISLPAFCEARDRLRATWRELPGEGQPRLPLLRSPRRSEVPPESEPLPADYPLAAFARAFDAFCDEWRILGMATWDLPDPDGPQWPKMLPPPRLAGELELDTPWHFPLLESDGLGRLLREEHQRVARAQGVDDPSRWPTYAQLLRLDHYERVLQSRYLERGRPRGRVTQIVAVLADVLELSIERVQKLRKLLSALRAGRRRSLAGQR